MEHQTKTTFNNKPKTKHRLHNCNKIVSILCIVLAFISFNFSGFGQCGFNWVETTGCTVDFEVNTGTGYDYDIQMGDTNGTVLSSNNGPVFSFQYDNPGNYTLVLTYYKNGIPRCGASYNISLTTCPDCDNSYYFSAQESTYEDCCIIIDAGSTSDCDNWHVAIDGTIYEPDDANDAGEFLHCLDENDTYLVEFFVDVELYWDREVELTTCEDCTGGYYFSAQESSYEDCCIIIDAGSTSDCVNWHIETDGTIYEPDDANGVGEFLHCLDENDTYLVEFFVDGQLYWDDEVELTTCEETCEDCELDILDFNIFKNGCDIEFCTPPVIYQDPCNEIIGWEIDYGDGNIVSYESLDNVCLEHTYSCNGTYEFIVYVTVSDREDLTCTTFANKTIVITDCVDCCNCDTPNLKFGEINGKPCTGGVCVQNVCEGATYEWTFEDETYTGTCNIEHTYECNGAYEFCWTMSYEDPFGNLCEETGCETINITNCDECDCDITTVPTNLQVLPGGILTWDPVPGATGYIISSPGPLELQINCGCKKQDYIYVNNIVGSSYQLNKKQVNSCFVWQVQAICSDGISKKSKQYCYPGKNIEIIDDTGGTNEGGILDSEGDDTEDPRGGPPKLSNGNNTNPISVYPNPTTDFFKLDLNNAEEVLLNIQLIDSSGRLVLENNTELTKGEHQLNFNVADLPRGVYVLKVSSEHINQSSKLLLIN